MSITSSQKVLFAIVYVVSFVLIGLGAIFLMAAAWDPMRLVTGGIMIGAGMALIIGVRLRQKVVVEQKVTLKPSRIKDMQCKECGANLTKEEISIKHDVVIVKCAYCGALYEMSDEPIW
ncbi:hypothetical protein GF325_02105 [Candidatus Bathyarchaeota archaeon]|nr:hypothetical protein [Candidatus Bathyarchaeota archaeon]